MAGTNLNETVSSGYSRSDYIGDKRQSSGYRPRKTGVKRRGNGSGTVEKTKNRRNPYKAKVPTECYTDRNGRTQVRYKTIGSFPTKGLADEALAEYLRNPYDLNSSIVTFQDLYQAWSAEYFRTLSSSSSIRTVTSAYAYCGRLYQMRIREIGIGHIKDAMNSGYVYETRGKNKGKKKYASAGTKERIKSLCNLMFDYALERNLVSSNPARAFKIDKLLREIDENAKKKKPFGNAEVALLWKYQKTIPFADMVLIGIYTGFRPQELLQLRTDHIFLDENYMVGGMKTVNGTNRMVPIHPMIRELVVGRYRQAVDLYHSDFLFNLPTGSTSNLFTYDTYKTRFQNVMEALNLTGFTPHCTRHTFATQAEVCGLRERAIKLILGHSLKADVTDYHYKHTDVEYLYQEICKLSFEEGAYE